ncbi:aminotransferase, partial [Pseudomonas aeruginosa]
MATSYSARSRAIEPFHVMALLARANELQAAGHDVIHLEIGEPDFTTAEPIVEAGRAALAAGHTRYTAARGLPALREAIAKFYGERYGVDLDPQRVLVTPGGS